jgi:hypothetical protein
VKVVGSRTDRAGKSLPVPRPSGVIDSVLTISGVATLRAALLDESEPMSDATAVLVVQVEIDPADDEEFNRWYDEEHVPEKLATPGFISARRFRVHSGESRYLVIYELENALAATSPAYMGQDPTEWGRSIMARWKTWNRDVWVHLST